jgi:hypothetical protein
MTTLITVLSMKKNNTLLRLKKLLVILIKISLSLFLLWIVLFIVEFSREQRPQMTRKGFHKIIDEGIVKMEKDTLLSVDDYLLYTYISNSISVYGYSWKGGRYEKFKDLFIQKHLHNASKALEADVISAGAGLYSRKYDITMGGRADYGYCVVIYYDIFEFLFLGQSFIWSKNLRSA